MKTKPTAKRIAIRITPQAERHIRSGHPWLFDRAITEQSHDGQTGDLAVIFDRKRRFLAIGLFDPHSPIRVRILHHSSPATIDDLWFHDKMNMAATIRAGLPDSQTNGYRLVHGEGDGLPGLVIDRYADTLVVKIYTTAWIRHLPTILDGLTQLAYPATQPQPQQESELVEGAAPDNGASARLSSSNVPDAAFPQRIVLRLSRTVASFAESSGYHDGQILTGEPLDGPVHFLENGLTFESNPIHGQKTGFFLDQRDNRAQVGDLSQGKRVLNVFGYTGGFSLYAARGGATQVTTLDISQPALDGATRNFALNPLLTSPSLGEGPKPLLTQPKSQLELHRVIKGDAFQVLNELNEKRRQFDLVIIDPPSFAKRQSEIDGALSAYGRLTQLGLSVLAPGGTIALASCSSRVDSDTFAETVHAAAARAGRPLREFMRTGHAIDHPISFKEGAYLKCVYANA